MAWSLAGCAVVQSVNWPSFRGDHASGVANGQFLPIEWDGEQGKNIRWKTPIPGLAHSSPIIWGDRLFVTTAISSRSDSTFRHGLYGDGDASQDRSVHRWVVYCLDKWTGDVLWEQTACEGEPKSKRHVKATYANSTPATNGEVVVAMFGSEGLYAYDFDGKLLWHKDLGVLDVGAYDAPQYEWGYASSPIIFGDFVIVQCDTQEDDFILACDIHTGQTVWKTARDELPSWGTPTLYEGRGPPVLVTNGSNFIRGYDPLTGNELWRLGGSSQITAPTPVYYDDLMIVASGRRPEKPVFAIRAGARGDITLEDEAESNEWIVWSKRGKGPYMPTPVIYRGYVYTCDNKGIFDCYDLHSGKSEYRERIPHGGGGFSGSPVVADGFIYLPSEDGDIFVLKTGPKFEVVAQNPIGERLMATPALSEGAMYVRAEHHMFAIGK